MRSLRRLATAFVGVCVAALPVMIARAAPLEVGAGKAYATPCAAVAAAQPDDVIEIAPGTYTDSCAIAVKGLTLRGVGGQPVIDLSGTDHPANYKGIYVIDADSVTIENLELKGAHISDDNGANAAGIRVEAADLTVRQCNIHDNQNGILGGTTGTLTIEHTEFFNNGLGDGCNQGGCTHNLYVANIDALYFRFNWSHRVATDTPDKGHLLKSRAKANYVEYNRLSGEDGFDSYEIDLPNGGLAVVLGNVIEKGPKSGNGTLLSWGEEGASNPDKNVVLINNTFVNDTGKGTFLNVSGAELSANNNLFAGSGSLGVSGLSADNLSGVDPQFVDAKSYDYHLKPGSPAIGKAVDPTVANQTALVESEYVHPLGSAARPRVRDVGAFEYETDTSGDADAGAAASGGRGGGGSGASGSGGRTSTATGGSRSGGGGANASGGASAIKDAGTHATGSGTGGAHGTRDGGADGDAAAGKRSSGCGCSALGTRSTSTAARFAIVLGALFMTRARTRPRRKHREAQQADA